MLLETTQRDFLKELRSAFPELTIEMVVPEFEKSP